MKNGYFNPGPDSSRPDSDINFYRIAGIVARQRFFFNGFATNHHRRYHPLSSEKLEQYLRQLEEQLQKKQISENQLNLASRTALTNLRGLSELYQNRQTVFTEIYHTVAREKDTFPRYARYPLILQFIPSRRLYHSLKISAGSASLKLSCHSMDLPVEYFQLLARDLFSRISGKKLDKNHRDRLLSLEKEQNPFSVPYRHQKKEPGGRYYNLLEIFHSLNRQYFHHTLPLPWITWSRKANRYRLGSYDHRQNKLVISKILDQENIPEFVIRGILYHEMLHVRYPVHKKNGRRIIHSAQFKTDEKKFSEYRELKRWLKEEYPAHLGKVSKRRRMRELL